MKGEGAAAFSAAEARLDGKDDGGADHEEEVRKDEIGEGESIPLGVVELRVGLGPVAGVVDEDHEGDGDAAEDVDGEDAVGGGPLWHVIHDRLWGGVKAKTKCGLR